MAKNPYDGKVFEDDFKEGCLAAGIIPIRLHDPMGQLKGVGNICDFIVYQYPAMLCFELKSTIGKSFAFSRLTSTQFEGMLEQYYHNKATCGALVHFTEFNADETVFIPIQVISKFMRDGKKSIKYEDALKHGVVLRSRLKRTKYEYFLDDEFFKEVQEKWAG